MRGKLDYADADASLHGITPAGAGKTLGTLDEYRGTEDHPRRCGENPATEEEDKV